RRPDRSSSSSPPASSTILKSKKRSRNSKTPISPATNSAIMNGASAAPAAMSVRPVRLKSLSISIPTSTSTKPARIGTKTSSRHATKSRLSSPSPMKARAAPTDSAASIPTTSRWIFPAEAPPGAVSGLVANLNFPAAAARLLYRRGYRDPESAWHFLNPCLSDLHDPFLLRDMDRAVERIASAISRRERIEIHGDYDVDGVTSTVVLKKALEIAGAEPGWHIPHRLNDGYGMQPAAID